MTDTVEEYLARKDREERVTRAWWDFCNHISRDWPRSYPETKAYLTAVVAELGCDGGQLAAALGVHDDTVTKWWTGKALMPRPVYAFLEMARRAKIGFDPQPGPMLPPSATERASREPIITRPATGNGPLLPKMPVPAHLRGGASPLIDRKSDRHEE